jgi:transglutaminase-like putative cysteine protease
MSRYIRGAFIPAVAGVRLPRWFDRHTRAALPGCICLALVLSGAACGSTDGRGEQPKTTAPTVTSHPLDQEVQLGQSASFTVAATGNPSPTFQWTINGYAVLGATSSTWTLAATKKSDNNAAVAVTASNAGGKVTSRAATLAVRWKADILSQPSGVQVREGAAFTLNVSASASPTPDYQWIKDGVPIQGATGSSFHVDRARTADAGSYQVAITNKIGSVLSQPAAVIVDAAGVAPVIVTPPPDVSIFEKQPLLMRVTATGTEPLTYKWTREGSSAVLSSHAELWLASPRLEDTGRYTVEVANAWGNAVASGYLKVNLRESPTSALYLQRAEGHLKVVGRSSTETYEAYFLVPIAFEDQAPILLTVESPALIDYRFVRLTPPNVLVAAHLLQAAQSNDETPLTWKSWVLTRENYFSDRPLDALIPQWQDLLEDVRPWLQPTDCAQIDDPYVAAYASAVAGTTTSLMTLADNIAAACDSIPGFSSPMHSPMGLDAYYALNWGSSCTGHAHAGAAFFRANGVPARSLLVMPLWYTQTFDMHWIVDYYVPGYGWINVETTHGQHPAPSQDAIVIMACNPEDEFPVFYPDAIEGPWHTSDPALGVRNPRWGGAHTDFSEANFSASARDAEVAVSLTQDVFSAHVDAWGLNLTDGQKASVQAAVGHQSAALGRLQAGDVAGYIVEMQQAYTAYQEVQLGERLAVFADDFEAGDEGWTHGGTEDTWTLGTPSSKPASAHSGLQAWGTGFSGAYPNNADSWLLSPAFDLRGLAGASLDFWLYNWTQSVAQVKAYDPLWVEVTTDGVSFLPICSEMAGVSFDPAIPWVGGWSHIVLDLTKYAGNPKVRVRFRFRSDASTTGRGSFIDDVRVYGRSSR